jgi:hypothetical protein
MRLHHAAFVFSLLSAACAVQTEPEEEHVGTTTDPLAVAGNGLSTCGPAHNESCGTRIPVKISDSKTIMLGKFDITAGRYRQFVNTHNGDIRGYITAHEPAWWNGVWRAKIAAGTGVGNFWSDVGGYGYDWTVWLPQSTSDVGYLLGPWNFGVMGGDMALTGANGYSGETSGAKPAVDWSMFGPANEGCQVGDFGARTYWQANGATGGDDNQYSQAALDKKALNCASFYMLAAFCAWDGGRLPTAAELDAAWGAETYPWGETVPFYADFSGNVVTTGPKNLADYGNAGGAVYENPAQVGNDQSNHLSIPGDFPKGNGPYGHADLAGLLIGMTGDISQATASESDSSNNSVVTVSNAPVVTWHRGGSWQGHQVTPTSTFHFIATNKYIAMGGRCAYDTGAPPAASFPNGFEVEYFGDTTLTTSKGKRVDPYVAFTSKNFTNPAAKTAATPYSVRWKATLLPRYTQTYTFETVAGDGMRLYVNGTLVIDDWTTHASAKHTGTIALTADTPVTLTVEHYNAAGNGVNAKVLWKSASQLEQVIPASVLTPN